MKYFTLCLLCLSLFAQASVQEEVYYVYFETDQHALKEDAQNTLKELAQKFKNNQEYLEFYISGHTDNDGSNSYNDKLAQNRTNTVVQYLTQIGLPSSYIEKESFGEKKPILPNSQDQNKALNRRVEIKVKKYNFENVNEIFSNVSTPLETVFNTSIKKDVVLKGKAGVELRFPAHCFESVDGCEFDEDNIQLKLTEATTFQDMISANVSCISDGKILESGGMFKIEAKSGDVDLKMKEDTFYTANIYKKNTEPKMTVFEGVKNESTGSIEWKNTEENFNQKSTFNGKMPFITLDEKYIDAWEFQSHFQNDVYVNTGNYEKSPTLQKPVKQPRMPIAPDINSKKYQLSSFQKAFFVKKKNLMEKEKLYAKDLELYEKRMDKYEKKFEVYENYLENKENINKENNEKIKQFHKEFNETYEEIYTGGLQITEKYVQDYFPLIKKIILKKSKNGEIVEPNVMSLVIKRLKLYVSKNTLYKKDIFYTQELLKKYNKFACQNGIKINIENVSCNFNSRLQEKAELNKRFLNKYFSSYFSYKEISNYFASLDEKLIQEQTRLGIFNPNSFSNFYTAELTKMKWINCDRFNQSEILAIKLKRENACLSERMYCIQPSTNTIISYFTQEAEINVPKNTLVKIVRIGLDKNNMPVMGSVTVNSSSVKEINIPCESKRLSDIKNELAMI